MSGIIGGKPSFAHKNAVYDRRENDIRVARLLPTTNQGWIEFHPHGAVGFLPVARSGIDDPAIPLQSRTLNSIAEIDIFVSEKIWKTGQSNGSARQPFGSAKPGARAIFVDS